MTMRFQVLGSGTCVPSLERSAPADYLRIGDTEILIDCGAGTLVQLEKAGRSYKDIDVLCVTHFHPDHTTELVAFIHALKRTPDYTRKKPLLLVGPPGFEAFYAARVDSFPLPGTFSLRIREITGTLKFPGFTVASCRTVHSEESIAYRFSDGNKDIVITGDTDFDEHLTAFAKGCDLLVAECSFEDARKTRGHLTPKECARIAKESGAKRLLLTHIYPTATGEQRLAEARKDFPATLLAEDLLELDV